MLRLLFDILYLSSYNVIFTIVQLSLKFLKFIKYSCILQYYYLTYFVIICNF